MKHFLRKFGRYLKVCVTIMVVSTFGQYKNSGWNGDFSYHLYHLAGKPYFLPNFEDHKS